MSLKSNLKNLRLSSYFHLWVLPWNPNIFDFEICLTISLMMRPLSVDSLRSFKKGSPSSSRQLMQEIIIFYSCSLYLLLKLIVLVITMKEQVKTDAQLSAMLSSFRMQAPEGLQCQGQKPIEYLCISSQCEKVSLVCGNSQCGHCKKGSHIYCHKIDLEGITSLLSQRTDRQREFIKSVCEIENGFIDQLHRSRQELTDRCRFGDLEEKYMRIVQKIYTEKDSQCLVGKDASDFCQRLEKGGVGKASNERATILLELYRKTVERSFEEIVSLKKKVYEAFSEMREVEEKKQLSIDSTILRKPVSPIDSFGTYDCLYPKFSSTLVRQLKQEQQEFLLKALNYPKKIDLLFRASEHNWKAAAFHSKCDNVTDTLVIARTQFGKTIAGFSHYRWNAVSNCNYVHDAGRKAFLLSFDLKEKMLPLTENDLIYCHTGWGPVFGGGSSDLCISDDCHISTKSYANFPYSYNCEKQDKYANNQSTFTAFSGATQGNKCKFPEYEVFKVIYE